MFVPDNAAFKPLEANLSRASTGRLADILKYHVLPKVRRIPRGFQSGSFETLLKGHSVDINASRWAVESVVLLLLVHRCWLARSCMAGLPDLLQADRLPWMLQADGRRTRAAP